MQLLMPDSVTDELTVKTALADLISVLGSDSIK